MKKRKFSKVIAVALAALMVIGMVPMTALADNVGETTSTVENADYYSVSHSYKASGYEDTTYFNYQYKDVGKDGKVEFDYGSDMAITMDVGEYTSTADLDSVGWHIDTSIPQTNSPAQQWVMGNSSSEQSSNWVATLADAETGESAGTATMTGFAKQGNDSNSLTVADGLALDTIITLPDGLEPGTYTLSVGYVFHVKYAYEGVMYWLTKEYSYSTAKADDNDLTFAGTDTITVIVNESDAKITTDELGEGITKTVNDNAVKITGKDCTEGASIDAHVEVTYSGSNYPYEAENMPVTDSTTISFNYQDGEGNKVIVGNSIEMSEIDETTISINDFSWDYDAIADITGSMIREILVSPDFDIDEGIIDFVMDLIGGDDFEIEVPLEDYKIAVEYTATATNVDDPTDVYTLEPVVDKDNNATFSFDGVPAGEYTLKIGYVITISFACDFSDTIMYVIPVTAVSSEDGTRTIESSDSFTLTITPCEHENVTPVPAVPATCETEGNIDYWYCEDCGRYFSDADCTIEIEESDTVIGRLSEDGQHHYTSEVTVDPGCTTKGETTYTCEQKDDSYTEEIAPLGHQYDADNVEFKWDTTDLENITCTAVFTCTACGDTAEADSIEVVIDETKTVITDCEAPADIDYVATATIASREGDVTATSEQYVEGAVPGHAYDDGEVIKAATCMEEGEMLYTCTRENCAEDAEGHTKTEVIPMTDHHYVVIYSVDPTCTEPGAYYYACQCDSCGDDCGCNPETLTLDDGTEISYAYTSIRDALGHTVVTDEAVEPGCTETGLTEGSHCSVCDEVLVAQEEIPATGHDYGEPAFKWTDSTIFGVSCTATITCANCGEVVNGEVVLDSEVTKEATCTETGIELYTATAAFEIKSENDKYYDDTAEVEPNSVKPLAVMYITYTDTHEHTLSAAGHDFDYDSAEYNWNEDYTACTAVAQCTRCDATDEQECTVIVNETAATCTEDGSIEYTATFNIGRIVIIIEIDPGVDYYSEPVVVPIPATGHELTHVDAVEATATEDGNVEYWYCAKCDGYFLDEDATIETTAKDVIIPATAAEERVPQYKEETLEGYLDKVVDGYDVTITGGAEDVAKADVAVSALGDDYPIGEIDVEDSVNVSFDYSGVYVDGTFEAASGSDVTFGVENFTFSYDPEIVITEELITVVLDQLGLGGFVSMLPMLGLDLPIIINAENGNILDTTANVTYTVTAVAADGTVYTFDVATDGSGNATFTCAGLPDGDYEVTVAYDIDLGFVYDYYTEVMGIGIGAAGTEEAARTISSSDSFTLTVAEGAVMGDTGTSGGSDVPSTGDSDVPSTGDTGSTGETETGETETGEAEHEHDFYIVDSQEATCEDEGWVLYACSLCGEQYTQTTAALGHDFVDGVCSRCGAIDPDYVAEETGEEAGEETETEDEFTEAEGSDEEAEDEEEDEFTEVEEDEFDVVSDESLTSPQTGASLAAVGAAMAFAAAGIVVVTRKKKEED